MRTLIAAGHSTEVLPLEMFWIEEDDEYVRFVGLNGEEFACRDRSCAPPPIGTGGSNPEGAGGGDGYAGPESVKSSTHYSPKGEYLGKAEHASDVAVNDRGLGVVRGDGILAEPWLDDDGNVVLTDKQIKTAEAALNQMGSSLEDWKANLAGVASRSMDADAEQAIRDSKWYSHEHETWGAPLAEEHGVTVAQVMGIASATSTNKIWDGVQSSNKEVTAKILQLLKDDDPITVTPEQAAAYNQFSIDKPKGGGKYGPKAIEPGEYRLSELSSGVLARVMGSGYGIGGKYFTDGLFKAFSIARGELEPNVAIGSLKQRSFVNNLVHPDKNYSVTNDFWMARAAFGSGVLNITTKGGTGAMTMREWEQKTGDKPNSFIGTKGTGDKSLFAYMTKAAKDSLRELQRTDKRFEGMLDHEYQALIWVQMQREYGGGE